ncbi:MAG TPA: ABC transporter substrate-binding protein [Xanthobacteraceae bacterium]|nr:ABC transporter substrate-binding protein [Xanthobacteraceae bacterium]
MRRRDFIKVIAGSAAAWPLTARAQQGERMQRVGVFVALAADDPETKAELAAFRQGLERLGWSEGHNLHIDYRFAGGKPDRYASLTQELVALKPDVLVAQGTPATAAMQAQTHSIPIVFSRVSDPVGSGFIASLARPGGNVTGVLLYEQGIVSKWLAMLKEIAPHLTRVALIANPSATPFDYFLRAAESAAPSLAIDLVPAPLNADTNVERMIEGFAAMPNGGLLFPPDASILNQRALIVTLAARYRLPAVYALRPFVDAGGLMSYSTDLSEVARLSATYVDRILRGAKPAELPVQEPTKYETVVNLKTAKTIGLDVPASLLVRADEVIE